MRNLIFILSIIIGVACNSTPTKKEQPAQKEIEKIEAPNWLIGNWERTGEEEGKKTYEQWKSGKNGELIGMGCTLQGQDTIWKEDIVLDKKGRDWFFSVTVLGNSTATVFQVTELKKNEFVCVNEENEFPKKIKYAFDGKHINAEISGGGPTIPFNFIPISK